MQLPGAGAHRWPGRPPTIAMWALLRGQEPVQLAGERAGGLRSPRAPQPGLCAGREIPNLLLSSLNISPVGGLAEIRVSWSRCRSSRAVRSSPDHLFLGLGSLSNQGVPAGAFSSASTELLSWPLLARRIGPQPGRQGGECLKTAAGASRRLSWAPDPLRSLHGGQRVAERLEQRAVGLQYPSVGVAEQFSRRLVSGTLKPDQPGGLIRWTSSGRADTEAPLRRRACGRRWSAPVRMRAA